jgi:tetratricopeptide (TPR) repeat protein
LQLVWLLVFVVIVIIVFFQCFTTQYLLLIIILMTKPYSPSKLLIVLLFGLCTAIQAQTQDDASDISQMLRSGQTELAAKRVETALSNRPKDPQLRFLRGVIQIEQKKNSDAIVTFQRMIEEFPELPEPYNNLAVLYAGQGQHDKARAALELAIRTHPSYATAHENLGDVYTKMASESYTKALQLDTTNNTAQIKLNTITSLATARPASVAPVTAPVMVSQQPTRVAAPVMMVKPIEMKPVDPIAKITVKEAVKQENKQENKQGLKDETDAVYEVVVAWAKAWGRKDVNAYLNMYSTSFRPVSGESYQSWAKERRDRIEGKRRISVSLESPTVVVKGDTAIVKFRQIYEADSLSANSRKVLKLNKVQGSWKIVEETTGN